MICKLLSALPLASESVPNGAIDVDYFSNIVDGGKYDLEDDNKFEQQTLTERVAVTECEANVLAFGNFFYLNFCYIIIIKDLLSRYSLQTFYHCYYVLTFYVTNGMIVLC